MLKKVNNIYFLFILFNMKKYINIVTTILLFLFSFFYTKKAISFLKYHDPLMQEILKQKDTYNIHYQNAIITSHYMIPGIKGKIINYNKSYQKMKKLNYFSPSLIVYNDINPEISINNQYDKVILRGNNHDKKIGFIIAIDNINYSPILNNYDIYTNKDHNKKNNYQNIITDNYYNFTNFCLYNGKEINNNCIVHQKYTINAIKVKSLQDVKENLQNNIVFLYQGNNENNLNIIIKYLKNNDYIITPINYLLKE